MTPTPILNAAETRSLSGRRSRIAELLRLAAVAGEHSGGSPDARSESANRVAQRLGIGAEVSSKPADARTADQGVLGELLADHGNTICRKVKPDCGKCALVSFCLHEREAPQSTMPTVVEVFAGAGGLGLGFLQAGFKVLAALELDRNAAQTYRLNHPGTPVHEVDVRLVNRQSLADCGLLHGNVDVLAAGPPCQGYSAAGKRNASDPTNQLFREVSRLAKIIRPRIVVVENVLGARGVDGVDFATSILASLHRAGYRAKEPTVHLASSFGVPQKRRRLIFIGARSDLGVAPNPPSPTHRQRDDGVDRSDLPLSPTVREALAGLPELGPGEDAEFFVTNSGVLRNGSTMRHSPKVVEKIRGIAQGCGPISYRRLGDTVAGTLVAGHRALPVHPWLDRTISVREAARIQGFPDDFVFAGPRASQPLQVANAVPPPLARAIAQHLVDVLDRAAR